MYNHDEDGFEEYGKNPLEGLQLNVAVPIGEVLTVSGLRNSPTTINVSKTAERNPKRDARMLAVTLSTSLDEQTVYLLAEFLFAEHLAPLLDKDFFKKSAMTIEEARNKMRTSKKKVETEE